MDAEQVIQNFWSSFELPAYDENSVPDNATLPYITYSLGYDSFDNKVYMYAYLYYRTSSWVLITQKAHTIVETLGRNIVRLSTDKGEVHISAGNPIYERMNNEDKDIKKIRFNIRAEYIEI